MHLSMVCPKEGGGVSGIPTGIDKNLRPKGGELDFYTACGRGRLTGTILFANLSVVNSHCSGKTQPQGTSMGSCPLKFSPQR